MTSLLRRLYPGLDDALRQLTGGRLYAAYQLPMKDVVRTGLGADPRPAIGRAGYKPCSVLSARKEHPHGGIWDLGSYRRVPDFHPTAAVSGTPLQDWRPKDCQYHAHVWYLPASETWDVACHYELRSSLFRPAFDLQRLRTHYRPEWGEQKLLGEMDAELATELP